MPATGSLLMIAIFVLAVSSLAGGISMLPGGLGVADAQRGRHAAGAGQRPENDRIDGNDSHVC